MQKFKIWYLAIGICLGFGILMFGLTTLVVGCGEGVPEATTTTTTTTTSTTTTTTIPSPSIPAGLRATGSLGKITLNWNASSGGGLTGYNIYRSTDEVNFTKTSDSPVASNSYQDNIASPAGDGVLYYYKVTAVGSAESGFSSTVKSVHGTRLPASSLIGFTTVLANSPYVAEGAVTVEGGDLLVDANTKLYVLGNSVVDIEQGYKLDVAGSSNNSLLRVLAATSEPATLTSHHVGGALADGEGFRLHFFSVQNYNASDGSGTLLQNSNILNLQQGADAIVVDSCSPKLYNLKVTSNSPGGTSYITLGANANGAIIENCYFNKISPQVLYDLRSTNFMMDHNIFRRGYYSIEFANLSNPGISAGQIEYNNFDATTNGAYLFNMTGGTDVPIGNNYWNGGSGSPPTPEVISGGGTTINFDFTPALSSSPAGVGPTW